LKAAISEVVPGIFVIRESGAGYDFMPAINCYVVAGKNGIAIDAGYGTRRAVSQYTKAFNSIKSTCSERGDVFEIRRIIITHTHGDHFSGLKQIRKKLGLKIILTDKMANYIKSRKIYRKTYFMANFETGLLGRANLRRFLTQIIGSRICRLYEALYGMSFIKQADEIVKIPDEIEVNEKKWMIIPSPGHCDDHISIYDKYRGIMFSGDNVLATITTWIGPPRSDLEVYINTLKFMLSFPKLKIILGSHGKQLNNPSERIKWIIEWREKRIDDVLRTIESSGLTGISAWGIIKKLYPGQSYDKQSMAEGWVLSTLLYLEKKGKIRRVDSNGKTVLISCLTGHQLDCDS
jgi:glyoxylase-like metal-dependent hydrolase (beta-lactamase superfamily II)